MDFLILLRNILVPVAIGMWVIIGLSMSAILSFTLWAIMKLWRFVVDIIKLSTPYR